MTTSASAVGAYSPKLILRKKKLRMCPECNGVYIEKCNACGYVYESCAKPDESSKDD